MDKNFGSLDDEWTLIPEQHQRTILHIDIDCFYAQVEMVRNPSLHGKPVGIKQKNIMITCNYIARSLGVKKSMFVSEALKMLPDLILVDGSDLTHYRQFSTDISKIVHNFSTYVERLGLDENFLDITERVSQCLDKYGKEVCGCWYGDKEENQMPKYDPCGCGCYERLIVGSHIAREVREAIYKKTGITCCAGIAHNKLIAKIVSGYHKPNDQTLIFPWQVCDLMNSLKSVRSIPGIGTVTNKGLNELGISLVQELQSGTLKTLRTKFDTEMAKKLRDWSFGIDESPVCGTVLPQSIGLEDAFKIETSFEKIKVKYKVLLERLLKLVATDGREPSILKVSARKFDLTKRYGHRDTKQVPLSSSFFSKGVENISESAKSAMMEIIVKTFKKLINVNKPFQLTMVGLAMTKFVNQVPNSKSIVQFFQSTSGTFQTGQGYRSKEQNSEKIINYSDSNASEAYSELKEPTSGNVDDTTNDRDFKQMSSVLLGTGKESEDTRKQMRSCAKMINTKTKDIPHCKVATEDSDYLMRMKDDSFSLRSDIDFEVYNALPKELQDEILSSYRNCDAGTSTFFSTVKGQRSKISSQIEKSSSIEGYLVPVKKSVTENESFQKKASSDHSMRDSDPSCSYSSNNLHVREKNICVPTNAEICESDPESGIQVSGHLPDGIDFGVFKELPRELQKEILEAEGVYKKAVSPTKSTKLLKKRKNVQGSSILKYLKKT